MKDLILSYATRCRFEDFRVFVASVRRACRPEDTDVVIFMDQQGDEYGDLAGRLSVGLSPVVNVWKIAQQAKFLNAYYAGSIHALRLARKVLGPVVDPAIRLAVGQWAHPLAGRWFAIAEYLRMNTGYRRVFISDLRDVVFQADPFPEILDDALQVCRQTGVRYNNPERVDTQWYGRVYGEAALKAMGDTTAVCAGTVFGGRLAVLRAVEAEIEEAMKHFRRPLDQAYFNHVVHCRSEGFNVVQHELGEGPVMTLVGVHRDLWTFQDGRLKVGDRVVPVIHMYDREPELKAHFQDLYAQA